MTIEIALFTLLHALVFVYWLGGDLGAFFSSYTLIDPKQPTEARLFALKVVNNVDMAPKTSLILTLPTGLTLAAVKGWLVLSTGFLTVLWMAAVAWLFLVWRIHLKHLPANAGERRLDIAVRWVLVVVLIVFGVARLTGVLPALPLFIAIKLLLLAAAMLAGLMVRRALAPLFVAVREMAANGPTPDGDAAMRRIILRRSKPTVVFIWMLVTAAAYCGIAIPM